MPSPHRRALAAALALAPLAWAAPALAQTPPAWPTKPVRLIVPFAPGGSSEIVARSLAAEISKSLGQQVYVENKPGAGGNVAMEEAARSTDGHTLILGHIGTLAVNPYIYPKLPYDPIKDFVPVVHATSLAMGLFVHPSVPARNLSEFLTLARAKPGGLSFATSGNGGAGHLGGELIKSATGIDMVHVPYRGSAPAIADVVAGQVPVSIADVPLAAPHVRSGALRPIALASAGRSAVLPDLPTFAELGIANVDFSVWVGFLAPAGTPRAIVDKLNREIVAIVREPAMKTRLLELGFEVVASSPAEFEHRMKADHDRFGAVVRNAGIKLE
jgi:tripartite-type tricarboxylate transporter receptor subunit TctC